MIFGGIRGERFDITEDLIGHEGTAGLIGQYIEGFFMQFILDDE